MRESEIPSIRAIPLFRTMAEANFQALIRAAYDQTFPAQVRLIDEGANADFLHVVMEGAVELFADWKARETTMAVARPISTFILAASIKDVPYLMSARTLERSRIILIPSIDLRAVFRVDADFAMATVNELAAGFRSMVRHTKDLKLRTARERLAAYILRHCGGAASFVLPVEKRLLASFLGMTPESLSRTIKSLVQDGAKVDGQRVIITDRAALVALAQPSELMDGPDSEVPALGVGLQPMQHA